MNHSTRHPRLRHQQPHFHADPAFNHVLAIFFEQGNAELAPSYIAYELDLTTQAAERLLDEMVKHSLLELDFDDNGQLYYSVSAEVLFEMQHREAEPSRYDGWHDRREDGEQAGRAGRQAGGFDGSVGQRGASAATVAPPRPRRREPRRQDWRQTQRQERTPAYPSDPNGCDGSVGPTGSGNQVRFAPRTQPSASEQARLPSPFDDDDTALCKLPRREDRNLALRRNADPMIAALLSVLLVGTGQIYNREVGKGLALFVVYAILLTAFFPVGWMVNAWAAVDAYTVAKRRKSEAA